MVFQLKENRAVNLKTCLGGHDKYRGMIMKHAGVENVLNPPYWSNVDPELRNEPGTLSLNAKEPRYHQYVVVYRLVQRSLLVAGGRCVGGHECQGNGTKCDCLQVRA